MAGLNIDQLTVKYFDVLKELGNIGAGNATSALAQLLGMKIDMSVPEVRLLEFKDVGDAMGGADQIMVGIYLMVEGDVNGSMMFLLSDKSARNLVNKLMQQNSQDMNFSEIELSAMMEVGNIITGAYLNSIATMTNLTMVPSVPAIAVDMCGAILSVPAIEFGMEADKILLIDTQFFDDIKMDGYFIMLPDLPSYSKILSSLGLGDVTVGERSADMDQKGQVTIIGMADLNICIPPNGISTLGLGSCVGVAIRDPISKVGGLAHIMLPDSTAVTGGPVNIPKYADTGIEELVKQICAKGAVKSRLVAKIAGGAQMFAFKSSNATIRVGDRNVEASIAKLKELRIPIVAQDTGESYGRTVVFYPETGDFIIRAVGRPEKTI